MFSRILLFPLGLVAIIFLYFTWEVDQRYSWYIIPPVVLGAVIYIMAPQIDWWWYKRFPPEPDERLRFLLHQHLPFYQRLSVAGKKRFRNRLAMYMIGREFMPQGMEDVPEDIKAVVASAVVQITFGQEDFLLKNFERIVVYPHPFPSPQYPEHWHSCELFQEDGVFLFSAEHLMLGFLHPNLYYNVALHVAAKAFLQEHPEIEFPSFGPESWADWQAVSGFSREKIEKWIGLPHIDLLPVSIVCYFSYPERFEKLLPGLYEKYTQIFGQV